MVHATVPLPRRGHSLERECDGSSGRVYRPRITTRLWNTLALWALPSWSRSAAGGTFAVACGIFNAEDLDNFAPVVLNEIDRLIPSKISWFNGDGPLEGRAREASRPYIDRVPFLEAWRRWSR